MVHGKNRIPYRIDRRLTGLAGPEYDATISFGLPFEPEDSQYGESRIRGPHSQIAQYIIRESRIRGPPISSHFGVLSRNTT